MNICKRGAHKLFSIAICDNEKSVCTQLEDIILKYQEQTSVEIETEVFFSGEELCKFMKNEHSFDLIFLDIELKLMNGIEAGRIIRQEMDNQTIQIVYISGKENYYKDLFEIRPMNFLQKPIEERKVINSILLALKLYDRLGGMFSYKKGHETYKKSVKKIIYFESVDREIRMISTDGEELFYGKLNDVYKQVARYCFMNIHKSYVVNYYHIIKFKYDEVTMSNSISLPISQLKRKEIKELQTGYEEEDLKI